MTIGARFAKWGLGLFLFAVFLTFGVRLSAFPDMSASTMEPDS